jgi:tRNA(Ile)-lysidine synthase
MIKPEDERMEPLEIIIPGKIYLPNQNFYLETGIIDNKKNRIIPKNSCMKWFDYDKIENAVVIRNRNEGDYIQINSSGGRKKLKDYFIDHKIPKEERDKQLLVADGSNVMWILGDGNRMSEKYKVEETTKKILSMKLVYMEEN